MGKLLRHGRDHELTVHAVRQRHLPVTARREAHVVVRAPSEDALAEWIPLAENLRFDADD